MEWNSVKADKGGPEGYGRPNAVNNMVHESR